MCVYARLGLTVTEKLKVLIVEMKAEIAEAQRLKAEGILLPQEAEKGKKKGEKKTKEAKKGK